MIQDTRLREIVEHHGARNWRMVAEQLGTPRSDVQCLHRYYQLLLLVLTSLRFNFGFAQSKSWLFLVSRFYPVIKGEKLWHCVQYVQLLFVYVARESRGSVFAFGFVTRRWNKVLRPGLHKGPWTEEEDCIVRECVELSGAQKVCTLCKLLRSKVERHTYQTREVGGSRLRKRTARVSL